MKDIFNPNKLLDDGSWLINSLAHRAEVAERALHNACKLFGCKSCPYFNGTYGCKENCEDVFKREAECELEKEKR